MKNSRNKSKVAPSPAALRYLALVDEWRNFSRNANKNTSNSNYCTDNQCSLLMDIANDSSKKDVFFASVTAISQLESLAQEKVLVELNTLYQEYTFATAKDASLTDDCRRDEHAHCENDDSLVYGEIDLAGFCTLLQDLFASSTAATKGIFYDLGSGSGRAVFCARLLGDYSHCIGIELLSNLHQLAMSVQSLYKFVSRHKLQHTSVTFVCSDLLDYDWSDGTLVYVPNLLFDKAMMKKIAEKATKLQQGAFLVSLKKFGQGGGEEANTEFHGAFDLKQTSLVPMSWGDSNVYVYQRR